MIAPVLRARAKEDDNGRDRKDGEHNDAVEVLPNTAKFARNSTQAISSGR
jgi:hypothetical protein